MTIKPKSYLLGTATSAAFLSALLSAPALAQNASPESSAQAAQSEETELASNSEIVVTGSRIVGGFTAPTPLTTATAGDLKLASPQNLADGLAQLPAFGGSLRSQTVQTAATSGNNGQSLLNLRNLGPNRTLILLDGRRLPASNTLGSVDVNIIPQNLIKRVDVVTGGASAAYGSDAVAGVVNFVLDTSFEGLKGEVQSGISTYGDLPSVGASIAMGRAFAGGRGRIIMSGEYFRQDGVSAAERTGRHWFDVAYGQIPNPGGTVPTVIVIPDIRSSLGSYGGLITSGPLRGTQFLPGGATAPFNYGSPTGSSFQSGGDGARANLGFAPSQDRYNAFLHAEYDLTDDLSIFAEGLYARSHSSSGNSISPRTGANGQFTIFANNAFLPAAVSTRMNNAGVTSFNFGRYLRDFPVVEVETTTKLKRFAGGVKGGLFDDWNWDASYSYGQVNQVVAQRNLPIHRNIYAAVDAVVNPLTGAIVCRSTLAGLDPGCVPLNLFGEGAPSQAAIDYVTGDSIRYLRLKQHVAAINVQGTLGGFSLGAGPIAIALGGEYRRESARQTVDALSSSITTITGLRGAPSSLQNRAGAYQFFNPLPLSGSYNIKEGYLEVGVPVLADLPFAQSLDLNGAIRYADYSQSGGVATWKLGFNYQVIPDVRLRLTRSRDIRGPNILELFNSATQNSANNIYKGVTTPSLLISYGNANLKPEKADMLTYGVVLRPSFLPGFQVSADYYRVSIKDAIGVLNAQRVLDDCAAGNTFSCSQFSVNANGSVTIFLQSLNLNLQKVAGYDFEAAYTTKFAGGNLSLRLLANHNTVAYSQAPNTKAVIELGAPTTPKWRGSLQMRYEKESWSAFVQQRYISRSKNDPNRVEGVYTNDNTVEAVWYTDVGLTARVSAFGQKQEFFLSVNNLFDRDPPIAPVNPSSYSQPINALAYDTIGRYFTVGLRFRL